MTKPERILRAKIGGHAKAKEDARAAAKRWRKRARKQRLQKEAVERDRAISQLRARTVISLLAKKAQAAEVAVAAKDDELGRARMKIVRLKGKERIRRIEAGIIGR